MKFCTKCGKEVKEEQIFCTSCGNELKSESSNKSEPVEENDSTEASEPVEENNATEEHITSDNKLTKKTKVIIAGVIILIVAIIAIVQVGNSLSDPKKLETRFQNDIASNNTDRKSVV